VGLAVVALVGAIVVGYAAGGTWAGLLELRLRWRALIVLAVLAQLVGSVMGDFAGVDAGNTYLAGLALSAGAAAGFCVRNLDVAGVPLITLGLICNATVVAANGAMPVSIVAAMHAQVSIVDIATGNDPRHTIAGTGTAYRGLGDVLPVPWPVHPEVVSPGDVLVSAGLGELVVAGMLRRRRKAGPPGDTDAERVT
jgi:hypothetical protein